jgi:hypothetical protein
MTFNEEEEKIEIFSAPMIEEFERFAKILQFRLLKVQEKLHLQDFRSS